jgi:hypothetical protein
MAGVGTLQPTYLPTPPTAKATTYNPATYDAAQYQAATYNPSGYQAATVSNPYDATTATNELNSAAGVQDQAQQQSLNAMLAAQGISPGSSAAQAADQNLASAQTAALAPALVSAQQYGAGLTEQSDLANQGALNTAGQFGASALNTAGQVNTSAQNAAAATNAAAQNTAGQVNSAAQNAAGQTNAASTNQFTLQDLQDLLQSQQFNASAANTAGSQAAQIGNNDWLAQLQAELGLQQQGLSTAGSLAGEQANQTVPTTPSFFSDLMGAASAAAPFSGSFAPSPAAQPGYEGPGEGGFDYNEAQTSGGG